MFLLFLCSCTKRVPLWLSTPPIIYEMKTTWFTVTLQKPGIGSSLDVPDEEHRTALNWGETACSAGDLSVQFARASADPRSQGVLCAIVLKSEVTDFASRVSSG